MSADIIDFETKKQKRDEEAFFQQLADSKGGTFSRQFTELFCDYDYKYIEQTNNHDEPPK